MSSDAKDVKFRLKVMVNKQKTKVLFAEVESDFADVLLSFLTLPLGTIVSVMKKHYGDDEDARVSIGSLTTLYDSLANLNSRHFWTEGGKQMLLNPRSSFESACGKLKLDTTDTQPIKYFRCADRECKRKRAPKLSMYYDTMKCDCGQLLSKPLGLIIDDDDDAEGFTKKEVCFLVTDNLLMAPIVAGSVIQTLINFGITITQGAELMTVTLGFKEIIDLLKGSLLSNTPLTDVILHQTNKVEYVTKDSPRRRVRTESSSSNSKKMRVKATIEKSTNKVYSVKAEEDFVDFLFSLLTIPLGGVEYLLENKTPLTNIDNLYRSVTELIDEKYFISPYTKKRLSKPELPPKYLSKNHIFPLTEQITPCICFVEDTMVDEGSHKFLKDPKGEKSYVKQPGRYTVTPSLTVSPLGFMGGVFVKRPLFNDAREMEVEIGLEEALNILNASLTSASPLSDGLRDTILKKNQSKNSD